MKKKMVTALSALMIMASLWGCGGSTASDNEDTEKAAGTNAGEEAEEQEESAADPKVEQINLDNAEGSLIYIRHELAQDYNGSNAVRIYFTYTNKSDETKTAQSTFYPQVFQNGVECEFTMGDFMKENEAESNLSKELMKDASLEVAFLYTLQDTVNPVVLRVNDQSAENFLDGIYQEQELALQ